MSWGERVPFAEPFTLERDVQRWRTEPKAFWRLSVDGMILGYAQTGPDTDPVDAVRQLLSEERARGNVWDQRPGALVWNVRGKERTIYGVFRYPGDAKEFVDAQPDYSRKYLQIEDNEGRRIIGITSHGHEILQKLDEN